MHACMLSSYDEFQLQIELVPKQTKMGKTSKKRQDNNIGCMSGLIRILYSRHKLLLDRKRGSASTSRHTLTGFPGTTCGL